MVRLFAVTEPTSCGTWASVLVLIVASRITSITIIDTAKEAGDRVDGIKMFNHFQEIQRGLVNIARVTGIRGAKQNIIPNIRTHHGDVDFQILRNGPNIIEISIFGHGRFLQLACHRLLLDFRRGCNDFVLIESDFLLLLVLEGLDHRNGAPQTQFIIILNLNNGLLGHLLDVSVVEAFSFAMPVRIRNQGEFEIPLGEQELAIALEHFLHGGDELSGRIIPESCRFVEDLRVAILGESGIGGRWAALSLRRKNRCTFPTTLSIP